jgi:hypothetical protein
MFIPKIIPAIPASQCRDDPPGTVYSNPFPSPRAVPRPAKA